MKNTKCFLNKALFIKPIASLLIIIIIAGCSEEGSIISFNDENSTVTAKKDKSRNLSVAMDVTLESEYPQSISCIATFKRAKNNYNGSACQLPNGSSFEFENGALTPPADHPWGEPLLITFTAEKDPLSSEIIYTFGPSDCSFDTPAEIWFSWSDLGPVNPSLFYLDEDEKRIEELPDQIDIYNKIMCIRIKHFSRYAVAYSN